MYHQTKAVVCPQNLGAALRSVGLDLETLAQMLQVQLVGEDRGVLRAYPDLQVSVASLRNVFRCLSQL